MTDRLDMLEQRVAVLEAEVASLRAPASTERAVSPWPAPEPAHWDAPAPEPPVRPQRRPIGIELDSEAVLKWGGVGLVVLAVAFLLSTAISRGWIGPELQLAGAVLLSGALIGVGVRLRSARIGWTHALVSAGVAVAVVTAASHLFRDQTTDTIGLGGVVVVSFVGLGIARWLRSEWTAATSFAGGVAGWLAIAWTPVGDIVAAPAPLVVWTLTVAAATVALAYERSWPATRLGAIAVSLVVVVGAAGEVEQATERGVVLAVAAVVATALVVLPAIRDAGPTWRPFDEQAPVVSPAWFVGVAAAADWLDRTGLGVVSVALGLVVTAGAWLARSHWSRVRTIAVAIGGSVALSIGLGLLLSGEAVAPALAAQTLGLIALDRQLGGNIWTRLDAGVLAYLSASLVVPAMVDAWRFDAPIGEDAAHLLAVALLVAAGWWVGHRVVWRLTGLAGIALLLVWLGSALVHLPQGQATVSIAWASVGASVLVVGAIRRMQDVAATGLATLGVTVGKLLTVDLRAVDTLWRAALFLVIGLAFLRLGFLLPRLGRSGRVEDEVEGG